MERWNNINNKASYENFQSRDVTFRRTAETNYTMKQGDLVLIPNSDKKNKLDKPFIGPHEVKELLEPYGQRTLGRKG